MNYCKDIGIVFVKIHFETVLISCPHYWTIKSQCHFWITNQAVDAYMNMINFHANICGQIILS